MAHILLIEPDLVTAQNTASYLKRKGHKVTHAKSAQAGIDAADTSCPDLVVLDLELPGHSGLEFLHELRSYPDWQNLPAIIYGSISSDLLNSPKVQSALTVSAYIHKPSTSLRELSAAIDKLLQPVSK